MNMRRYTRLTNAFSKKLANHVASLVMWSLWYDFGRVHQATPRYGGRGGAAAVDHARR